MDASPVPLEPPWNECRPVVAPLAAESVLGAPPPALPRWTVPASRDHRPPGASLVVTADGWSLDGASVDALPDLDRVNLFADASLSAAEADRLFAALRAHAGEVWLAVSTDRPPEGVDGGRPVDWATLLGSCAAGRRLLRETTCEGVVEGWREPWYHGFRCPWPGRWEPFRAAERATTGMVALVELDLSAVTYWRADQTLAELQPGEGSVVLGERPPDSPRAGYWWYVRVLMPAPPVPFCEAYVRVAPGRPAALELGGCPESVEGTLGAFVARARWDVSVGSERDTVVRHTLSVRLIDRPTAVDPGPGASRTLDRDLLDRL